MRGSHCLARLLLLCLPLVVVQCTRIASGYYTHIQLHRMSSIGQLLSVNAPSGYPTLPRPAKSCATTALMTQPPHSCMGRSNAVKYYVGYRMPAAPQGELAAASCRGQSVFVVALPSTPHRIQPSRGVLGGGAGHARAPRALNSPQVIRKDEPNAIQGTGKTTAACHCLCRSPPPPHAWAGVRITAQAPSHKEEMPPDPAMQQASRWPRKGAASMLLIARPSCSGHHGLYDIRLVKKLARHLTPATAHCATLLAMSCPRMLLLRGAAPAGKPRACRLLQACHAAAKANTSRRVWPLAQGRVRVCMHAHPTYPASLPKPYQNPTKTLPNGRPPENS